MNRLTHPKAVPVDWSRDVIADQAVQFVRLELDDGLHVPGLKDNRLLERCTAHLMALCNCSKRTAETNAAQVIAELASKNSRIQFDMHRSTNYALFVKDSASGVTRVISALEVMSLLSAHDSKRTAVDIATN